MFGIDCFFYMFSWTDVLTLVFMHVQHRFIALGIFHACVPLTRAFLVNARFICLVFTGAYLWYVFLGKYNVWPMVCSFVLKQMFKPTCRCSSGLFLLHNQLLASFR